MPLRLLLGPQRPHLILGEAIARSAFPEGPMAIISAGWQEAEADLDHVKEVVGRPLVDLRLYQRTEQVFATLESLRQDYRERQDQLKRLQRLYRQRLRQLTLAARHLVRSEESPQLVAPEQRHAMAQLRALDQHHQNRIDAIHRDFELALAPQARELLAEQQAQIDAALEECQTVIITGGHVAVLVNRLRLFDMRSRLPAHHLVAWSAGAMALGQTVVLFHDRLPQGRRDPEVLESGVGIIRDRIFLPDTGHRLRSSDTSRIELFARRFSPSRCLTLASGVSLLYDDNNVLEAIGVKQLTRGGLLQRMRR